MICKKCNEQIPDESKVCPNCEADLTAESCENAAIPESDQAAEVNVKTGGNKSKIVICVIFAVVAAIAVAFGVSESNKKKQLAALTENIQGDWYIHEEFGTSVLYFDDGDVEYGHEAPTFGYFPLLNGSFEAVSGNEIQSDLFQTIMIFTVEFNEDKTEMYINPSPRGNGDITETWTTR